MQVLEQKVTGRQDDLFREDLTARRAELLDLVAGSSILAVGAAGTIGSATVRKLLELAPARVHVVDQSENGLVELTRDLRSSRVDLGDVELRTFPLDFGSPIFKRLLDELGPYDYVFNFAALKHVRSEKDIFSLLQMIDTNVVKAARLQRCVGEQGAPRAYFSVSSDKAVNPASLMGASKRAMEHLLFVGAYGPNPPAKITSARFANVAFSEGSLLDGWLRRLQKRQPLAVPSDIQRYFVTARESGSLCLLAGLLAPHRHTLIPRLEASSHLRTLESVAVEVLEHHGYEPRVFEQEDEARAAAPDLIATGRWPLVLTPPDTSGEKPYEEFASSTERITEVGLHGARAVAYSGTDAPDFATVLARLSQAVESSSRAVTKEEVVGLLEQLVPELQHVATERTLDERM